MVVHWGNVVVKHDKTNHNGDILSRKIEDISPIKWIKMGGLSLVQNCQQAFTTNMLHSDGAMMSKH